MIDFASLELSRELDKLTGGKWRDTEFVWLNGRPVHRAALTPDDLMAAPDLGWLIRKLPRLITEREGAYRAGKPRVLIIKAIHRTLTTEPSWKVSYGQAYQQASYTPEDAACKLLCELVRQKVVVV